VSNHSLCMSINKNQLGMCCSLQLLSFLHGNSHQNFQFYSNLIY
jgi:hypothetical protein